MSEPKRNLREQKEAESARFSLAVLAHKPGVICLLLALGMAAVYLPVSRNGFVNYDDSDYVTPNPHVLSAFFFLLTLFSYARYVELKSLHGPRYTLFYALSLLLFGLGLMSKPMLVTVPFVLLLLDYWPLGRVTANAKLQTPNSKLQTGQ